MPKTKSKTEKLTPPLKWPGGKGYLAKRIVEMMEKIPHEHYVEPFFGGGAVLLERNPEGTSEVVNDLDRDLTNFWCVLQNQKTFAEFQRQAEAIPFSEYEWNCADEMHGLTNHVTPDVAAALWFFVRCRQSRAGTMKGFATLTKDRLRRGMNEQASAWLGSVEGLPEVHARLKRVVILNARPAVEVIRQQDGFRTMFYLDAPYVHSSRATPKVYAHEMTDDDHRELVRTILGFKGKFLVSMYHHPIYDVLLEKHGWRCVEFKIDNKASGKKTKPVMTECVFLSPNCG